MKITYSFSRWNGITTKTPYHKKPTIKELTNTRPSKIHSTIRIHEREDGVKLLIDGNFVELRATVLNGITANKYSDCYTIS